MNREAGASTTRVTKNPDHWRRHANPWSVWTRLAGVPVVAIVIHARVWIGWWSLLGVGLVALWMYLNVRVFPRARTDRRWEARAIFGEKFWLERKHRAIPPHHLRMVVILNVASSLSVLPMAYGLAVLDPWATAVGVVGLVGGQLWVLDRYSWIYADLTRERSEAERASMVDGAL